MSSSPAPSPVRAVVLAATRAEAAGAALPIAGLTVVGRAMKQLGQSSDLRVVVASDGSIALPEPLPPNAQVRPVADAAAASDLARGLAAPLIGADVVRLDRGRWEGLRVTDEPSRRAAEDAVFGALFRADLGFVARRLNKPISVRVTRHILVRTPITPNQITLFAAALGLVGCALMASGRFAWVALGLLLEHLQSVLDGCDGELARVRFQQSKLGAWLDTFVDDVLNVLMTACAGIGLWRAGAGRWALLGGLGGAAMLILSNLIIMRDMRRQRATGDLMDMVWWFSGGRKLGESTASQGKPSLGTFLFTLGRRDTAILLWLLFALLNQFTLVLVMAFIIALSWFVAALIQLIVRPSPAAR
ncbi:MAG TPA: CDP-alcohol phosphatidyltransferase family protein [Polyangia bacterium]|nr:CDP-alcohol phosphatidyltransferase family protein [Polyangia bacterium]